MAVQTILLDFSIEPSRISDDESRKDLVKVLENGLTEHFPQLKLCYELTTADGCLVLFSENQSLYFHVRLFNHGIITINAEYFKPDAEAQIISFDVSTCHSICHIARDKFYEILMNSTFSTHEFIGLAPLSILLFDFSVVATRMARNIKLLRKETIYLEN